MPKNTPCWSWKKIFFFFIGFLCLNFLFPHPAKAITVSGTWSAEDIIRQSGGVNLNIPAKGGAINGTFSGSGSAFSLQYGGKFTGNYSGDWGGKMSGAFNGWVSYQWHNPSTNQDELVNNNIQGSWSGYLNENGTGHASFINKAKYGLDGSVNLNYSIEAFAKELGSKPPSSPSNVPSPSLVISSSLSPSPNPSPSPIPSPEPRIMKFTDLDGNPITSGRVRIRTKDGKLIDKDLANSQLDFDKSEVKSITIQTDDGKKISLSGDSLDNSKVIMSDWDSWQDNIKIKLSSLAKILNDGQSVNLDDYFNIDWESTDNAYQPPIFDFLRKFGVKDKISFYAGYITVNSDVNTPVHEALGHGLTEVIGGGNKFKHAGGPHDDPWQPTYKDRSIVNPLRWFGEKTVAVGDEQARGFAMSEGWAQYVGDKWQRELTQTPDDKSEFTKENAQEKIETSKVGTYGQLYKEDPGYGAKVENVVATAFNELYESKGLEDVVSDFQAVRNAYKQSHGGESFQNINQYLEQKLKMITDKDEIAKINQLKQDLQLE